MSQWTVFGKYLLLQKKKINFESSPFSTCSKFQMENKIEKKKPEY